MVGIFLSILSMLLYLAETGLQLQLASGYATSDTVLFSLYATYVLSSLVVVNIVSAFLVLRTMDFGGKHCARVICILLHTFQLGLLWRCFKLLLLYDKSDWKEFLVLRLIHTGLQSLPFILTCGYTVINSGHFVSEPSATLIIMFISSAIALSSYNIGKFVFEADEYEETSRRVKRPVGIFFLIFGTLLMLLSRCGSLVLLMAVVSYWVALPIFVHFIIYFMVATLYRCCNSTHPCCVTRILKTILISYLNIFDLVEPGITKIHCRNVFYYSGILLQNVGMVAPWMIIGQGEYMYKLCTVLVILLGYIFGVVFKTSSCGCIHESMEDNMSVDTIDIAEYIAKEREKVPPQLHHRHRRHKHRSRHVGEEADFSSHNGGTHAITLDGYDNGAFQTSMPKLNGISPKKKRNKRNGLDTENGTDDTAHAHNKSGSNGDVASSNSRNTNTLNTSGQSNHDITKENEIEEEREKYGQAGLLPLQRSSIKGKPELKVRNGASHSEDLTTNQQHSGVISPSPSKKSKSKSPIIPLFPNECNDIIGSKEFGSPKAKHILSNSVDEYNPDDTYTDTSDSEYISYSYYYDTDFSTMFSDSDLAATWPPNERVHFSNLHDLPKSKISNTESVQLWLSRLEECEPIHEYSDIPSDPPTTDNQSHSTHFSDSVSAVDNHIHGSRDQRSMLHNRYYSTDHSPRDLDSSTSVNENNIHNFRSQRSHRQDRYLPNDHPPRERYYSSSSANENNVEFIRVKGHRGQSPGARGEISSSGRGEQSSNATRDSVHEYGYNSQRKHNERKLPEILLNPKDAIKKFCNVNSTESTASAQGYHVPMETSRRDDRSDSKDSNAVILWQTEEHSSHDFVQESMV